MAAIRWGERGIDGQRGTVISDVDPNQEYIFMYSYILMYS